MNKITTICALLTSMATVNANAETIEILGDESYAPYVYLEDGKAKGIYTDILRKASEMMPTYDISFKLIPWKDGVKEVKNGTAFALYPPYKTRDFIDYSTKMFGEKVVIICNKKKVMIKPMEYPSDYHGKTIGNNSGFASPGKEFFADVKAGKIILEEEKTTEENLTKLMKGDIDCYVNDSTVIKHALSKVLADKPQLATKAKGLVEYATINISTTHVGFTQKGNFPYREAFEAELNAALKSLRKDGTVKSIVAKYQ